MILSDREIRLANDHHLIRLIPCPAPGSSRWSSTTVDLTLDAELRVWRPGRTPAGDDVIDPVAPGYNTNQLIARDTDAVDCTAGFVFEPTTFLLGWTVERLRLPHESRIAARVEGKSSLARIGVGVHVTAPIIHPGFGATSPDSSAAIRLEIWNVGTRRVRLTKGMPICQLMFEEVRGFPESGYQGQFAFQGPGTGDGSTATGS
jgi:dCTP deaminase